MDMTHFFLAAVILFGASLIQSMIGFAFNLIAIPLLVWSGFTLGESVAMTAIPIFVQLSLSGWQLRGHIIPREIVRPALIRFLTLPAGIALLAWINAADTAIIKTFVGVVLLAILFIQHTVRFTPRTHLHPLWDWLAFGLSGLMLGMVGMGGPPVVLWLMAHDWPPKRIRAFVTALFWIAAPVQIALLYGRLGDEAARAFGWGLLLLPVVIVAALLGVRIGNTFDRARLQQAVTLFLFLTAIASMITPWLK